MLFLWSVTPSLPGGRAWSSAAKKKGKKDDSFCTELPQQSRGVCTCMCVCVCARVRVQTCSPYVSVCARVTVQRSPLAGLSVKLGINELGLR